MKIVMLDGGLSNQLTQYIFARCLEIETSETVFLDDSWFFRECSEIDVQFQYENTLYQLNRFSGTTPHLLSQYFTPDVWTELMEIARNSPQRLGGSHMPQILKDNGLDFFMIAECPTYLFDGMIARMPYYHYIPEMLKAQGNVYYWGYFTNGGWFKSHEEIFRKELVFPPLTDPEDFDTARQIKESYSVGIHVRRGSYTIGNNFLANQYYHQAIREVLKKYKNNSRLRFFIFSDDIEYCREHAHEYGFDLPGKRVVYGREQKKRPLQENHCDLQLMALCNGLILSNSVYSYMAWLFNTRPDKWCINPVPSRDQY